MACNSKLNTISHLQKIGVIDENNQIVNIPRFNQVNQLYEEDIKKMGITIDSPLMEMEKGNLDNSFLVTNDALFEKIDQQINENTEELYEPLDYFENLYDPNLDNNITPAYDSYIIYKKNLLKRLNNRLAKIEADKKKYSSDKTRIKELSIQQNIIENRINGSQELEITGLEQEIKELEAAPAIDKIASYVMTDFERLDALSKSNNVEDLREARVIINFYKALGDFDISKSHPMFEIEDIVDEQGNILLPEDIVQGFLAMKEKAIAYSNGIERKEKEAIVSNVNNNTKVKGVFDQDFSYDELFFKGKGLKDIPWVDMFLMDVTNGIFSTNGIMPQVMMNNIQNAFESNLTYAKTVENRLNDIQQDVERVLQDMGYSINIPGIKGVSYDLFRAKDANGQFKDSITQRYNASFFDARDKMYRNFDQAFGLAMNIDDPGKKQQAIKEAYIKRDNWYKKNTIVFDVRKLPETSKDKSITEVEKAAYKQSLVDILGENGYNEEVKKQEKLLADFNTMSEIFLENLIVEERVTSEAALSKEGKRKYDMWIKRNDPYQVAESYYDNKSIKSGKLILNSSMKYNYSIPRRTKVLLKSTPEGLAQSETKTDTGYYDSNFATIEANDTLKEFHNLLMEVHQKMFDIMPTEVRERFSANSLPTLEKNLIEILFDTNIPLMKRLSKAARELYDRIRALFGINIQNALSYANVDPITGQPEYKVNDAFLKSNRPEINKRYDIEVLRLKRALGLSLTKKITKFDTFDLTAAPQEVLNTLSETLNVPATLAAIQARLPNEDMRIAELGRILRSGITDQIVKEQSFDLPKILKLYSYLTMEYAARQEVLPLMEMMKSHYEEIKQPASTNTGATITNVVTGKTRLEGERVNAIKQMNSWFERVVLGNYGSKNELGDTTIKKQAILGLTGSEKIDSLTSKLQTTITGRILNTDEKILKSKIPSLVEELEDIIANSSNEGEKEEAGKLLSKLDKIEEKLGKHFSVVSTFDAIFNFIRFKGLGWNVSSYVTNFMEGQVANMTVAATGDYFTPENIYRATDIVKGSFLKIMTFGKFATDGAKKTRVLMDRYRILQDASNELQKASAKTNFSKLKNLDPYEGTKRTEYLNQAPLMISVLMDQEVTGINGETSNVWDAMNPDGTMKDNFKTEENIANWESADGANYRDFSSSMRKLIVNAHGDYDELRGNMGSEFISGKALLMFKRWMSRQFYQRFAMISQPDIEVGIKKYKGRYLSHTQSSGFAHGAIVGFGGFSLFAAGPLGILIGGAVGGAAGKFFGANTGLNFLQELSFVSKELFLNLLRLPVNVITGKNTVKDLGTNKVFDRFNLPTGFEDLNLEERDVRNLKANLIDMAITLAWVGMLLFTKSLLWDDEDDSDDTRRKAHNLLANRFMQLSSQATMYSNIVEAWKNTAGNLPMLKFFTDIGKLGQEAADFLKGDDILAAGPNAGESALGDQFKKTLFPAILKGNIGFEAAMQKQFRTSTFDSWFHSEEKKAKKKTQAIRARYRLELTKTGDFSKSEIKSKVKKKFPNKKKGQSYTDLLEKYNKVN